MHKQMGNLSRNIEITRKVMKMLEITPKRSTQNGKLKNPSTTLITYKRLQNKEYYRDKENYYIMINKFIKNT